MKEFIRIAQEKLKTILNSIENSKNFIIEESLIKPLEIICSASWLRSNGISKIYRFDKKLQRPCENSTNVFFINSDLKMLKITLDQIHSYNDNHSDPIANSYHYHIIFFPDVYLSFYKLLEEEALYGIVKLHRFNWNFIQMDDSLYSLELNNVFSEIFLHDNLQVLKPIAQSFRMLNLVIGKPDYYICCGANCLKLTEMITKYEDNKPFKFAYRSNEISSYIFLDRSEDYASCLLTPSIYAGLINEIYSIKAGEIQQSQVQENLKIFSTSSFDSSSSEKINFKINSKTDRIFEANRYKHFVEVSQNVQASAKQLGGQVKHIHNLNLPEIEEYITKNLPKISLEKQNISKHMKLCEVIIKMLAGNFRKRQILEEDIIKGLNKRSQLDKLNDSLLVDGHILNSMRLLCLMSISGNLNMDEYYSFVQLFCSIFGYEHLITFKTLSYGNLVPKIGMQQSRLKLFDKLILPKFDDMETYQILANKLNTHSSKERRVDYVFNGTYIPLVVKILLTLFSNSQISGAKQEFVDKINCIISEDKKRINFKQFKIEFTDNIKGKSIFVFILGGVTYAEIAACEHFSKISGIKIFVGSNCIINGKEIIANAIQT